MNQPEEWPVLLQKALAAHQQGDLDFAAHLYLSVLDTHPDQPDSLHLLGVIAAQRGRFADSLELIDAALRVNPGTASFHSNRGIALDGLGRLPEARESLMRALEFDPEFVDALINLGNVEKKLGKLDEAFSAYRKAESLRPDHLPARWNQGIIKLLQGDFSYGLPRYELREQVLASQGKRLATRFPGARWSGTENIREKTILLLAEQGLGDSLQFCRYVPMVAACGARVVLQVQRPLERLLATTFAGCASVVPDETALPVGIDFHCPLLSLPLAFHTTLQSIPKHTPYLKAETAQIALWQERLGRKMFPRVGLCWSGNPDHPLDRDRRLSLAELIRFLPPSIDYISLQPQIREDEKSILAQSPIRYFGWQLKDFTDTAALCECLDLVVSIDTSVAHLAGSLGRPTRLLLPYIPDWRWLLHRSDSPWYPSMTLHRQSAERSWAPVLTKIRDVLCELSQRRAIQ